MQYLTEGVYLYVTTLPFLFDLTKYVIVVIYPIYSDNNMTVHL